MTEHLEAGKKKPSERKQRSDGFRLQLTDLLVGESEAEPHHTEVLIIAAVSGFNSGRGIEDGC